MRTPTRVVLVLLILAAASLGFWFGDFGQTPPAVDPADRGPASTAGSRTDTDAASQADSNTRGSVITGRIVDQLGTALGGVQVAAESDTGSWRLASPHALAGRRGTRPPDPRDSTDGDGRFRLVVRDRDAVAIVVRHPHFAPKVIARALTTTGGRNHDLGDVILPSTAGLLVEVRGEASGLPIQGARVRLTRTLTVADLPGFAEETASKSADTDAEGIATFYGVQAGTCTVRVEAQGRATREIVHHQPTAPAQPPRAVVSLSRGMALVGRVLTADGKGVDGALVACTPANSAGSPAGGRLTTRTRSDGQFQLEGLSLGRHRIEVESSTHGRATRDGWDRSEGFLTIRLPRGLEVHGRVLSARDRRPIAGAMVTLEVASGWPVLRDGKIYRPTARTNGAGIFRFRGIPPGIIRLTASSEGLCPAQLGPIKPNGESLTFMLKAGFTITGKVLSPAGLPLRDAVIQTAYNDQNTLALPGLADRVVAGRRPLPTVKSAPGGRFQVSGLTPGRYRLVIRSEGLPPVLSDPFTAVAGQQQDLGTIPLLRGGSIRGRAWEAAGKPASGATVYLHPNENLPFAIAGSKVRCDVLGFFRLPIVAPGTYRMFYDYPDKDSPRTAAARRAATGMEIRVLDQQVLRQDLTPRVR